MTDYFGVCPECHKNDGYMNVGRGHWFYCKEHRVKWCVGSNLFSSWQEETEPMGEFRTLPLDEVEHPSEEPQSWPR